MASRDLVKGRSDSLNKTISEIRDFLGNDTEGDNAGRPGDMGVSLRDFLRKKVADLAEYWHKRGVRRGHWKATRSSRRQARFLRSFATRASESSLSSDRTARVLRTNRKTCTLPCSRPAAGYEARMLLNSINTGSVVGLRDRALIALMTFTIARVGAAVVMRVEDYYVQGRRGWVRLHEKGGKRHDVPANHNLDEYLEAYIKCAGLGDDSKRFLCCTTKAKTRMPTARPMSQSAPYRSPEEFEQQAESLRMVETSASATLVFFGA